MIDKEVSASLNGRVTPAIPVDQPPDLRHRAALREFEESRYPALQKSYRRNRYFHNYLIRMVCRHVVPGASVLDVGCGNGRMLAATAPAQGVGIDINPAAIAEARRRFASLVFHETAVEDIGALSLPRFDYIIVCGVLQQFYDLHTALAALRPLCHRRTRLILCTYSRLWQPVLRCAEIIGRKQAVPDESWLPGDEVANVLSHSDFSVIRQIPCLLLPLWIPLLGNAINRWIAPLPVLRHLGLCTLTVARPVTRSSAAPSPDSVSIVVPVRNEAGNIEPLLRRLPQLARKQEVIFVEGHSTDDTWSVVQRTLAEYHGEFLLTALRQNGRGKGDAVRAGFAAATGDILLILDGDLSVPPEELPRFVQLIHSNQCEFANGSRLVYPMDKQAMQFLNILANKCFGYLFTFLLGQRLRDTLCGTKVLRRDDYLRIAANRGYFGDFDPFGDFDLLFGAARLNLKILDVPVHYKQRAYGRTNISRFRHGLLLLRMCLFAARKLTFI